LVAFGFGVIGGEEVVAINAPAPSWRAPKLRAVARWSDRRVYGALIALIGILALATTAWIYSAGLTYYGEGPIRSDGEGYYVYLPAVLLDHDLTLRRTAERSFGGDPAYIQGVRWAQTTVPLGYPGQHQYLDQYGIGEAVLISPFFVLGWGLAIVMHQPRDGFSWPFQAAASAAGLVYMLLGLALVVSILIRWFSRRTVVITLIALTFGAAVFDYGTSETTMSHAYSFFAIALVVRLALSVQQRPRLVNSIAFGASLGLVGLIRATNLTILLFCLLIGIARWSDLGKRGRALLTHLDLLAIGTVVFLLVLLPQSAYWYRITGAWITNPYRGPGEGLDLLHPHLIGVLFSVRKGLFFWTPLLLLSVIGIPFLRRTARPLFIPTVVYLPIAIWVVSSWSIWWYGGSFGMRALIDEIPVFALGLAALIETTRSLFARRVVMTMIALTTLIAVQGLLGYWLKTIPIDHATIHQRIESVVRW
jgi:hypothetical protein